MIGKAIKGNMGITYLGPIPYPPCQAAKEEFNKKRVMVEIRQI